MRFVLVFSVFLLCATGVFAESQPPTPSRGEEIKQPDARPQEYKEATSPSKVRTELFTAINKLLDSQNQENTADSTTTSHNKESSTHWWKISEVWIAIFTGILAFITFFLALFTYKLWSANKIMIEDAEKVSTKQSIDTQESLRLTTISADAAQESIKALCLIERAYVFVGIKFNCCDIVPLGDGKQKTSRITIHLRNYGKTPAILAKVYMDVVKQDIYPTIIDDASKKKIPSGIIITADEYPVNKCFGLSEMEWGLIESSQTKLICYGRVEYLDVLKDERTTWFCWEYYPKSKDFIVSDNKELNRYK
jgi:hypothetical protein